MRQGRLGAVLTARPYADPVKRILLTAWLILPLAVVVFLCVWIAKSISDGAISAPAPRGQGAGQTGGANAIGELLAGRRADGSSRDPLATQAWELIVEAPIGAASPESALYVTNSLFAWEPGHPETAMIRGEDGLWRWRVEARAGETFEFVITRGSWESGECAADGAAIPRRTLPTDVQPDADGVRRVRIAVEAFRDALGS